VRAITARDGFIQPWNPGVASVWEFRLAPRERARASGNFASPRESGRGRGEAAGAGVGCVGPEVPAGLRGRRAKRGGRGERPARESASAPLPHPLPAAAGRGNRTVTGVATPLPSPLPAAAGRGNRTVTGVATPGFHGRVKPFGDYNPRSRRKAIHHDACGAARVAECCGAAAGTDGRGGPLASAGWFAVDLAALCSPESNRGCSTCGAPAVAVVPGLAA
jgi:hypothetical protein